MGDPRLCRAQLPPGRLGVGCACVALFYEGDTRDHEDRGRKPLEAVLAALTRAYLAYSPTEPRMAVPGRPLPHTLREIPFARRPRAVKSRQARYKQWGVSPPRAPCPRRVGW